MTEQVPDRIRGDGNGAQVVDQEVFHLLLALETRKAQRLRYLVSVVCMDVSEPPSELAHAATVVERVAPAIRSTDAMVMQTGSSVAFLLIDADSKSLATIMGRVTANCADIPWSAGGACYPETARSAKELLGQAGNLMALAKRDGDHRFYLPM